MVVVGLLMICFALVPNLNVLAVSSQLQSAGPTFAIITVFELPPRELRKSFVKALSRYGAFLPLQSALMTFPNVCNETFIPIPSSALK
jgi:hypothetical protein